MPQILTPHFEIVFCVSFVVGVYYFGQFAGLEFAIDPFELGRTEKNTVTVKFALLKLACIFVSVAEVFLSVSLKS
jgi:hypothetical protein